MLIQTAAVHRLLVARLNPGDDLLRSLAELVRQNEIRSGVILNGIGSLSRYHVHVVKTTNLPPGDTFFEGEGPFDILNVTGFILDGRVHAHLTFSNTEKAMGGHLEEGCRILTFAVVTLAETPEASLGQWDRVGPLE
jgi:predicted DNA-binding protein with PD1-like motif